MPAACTTWLEFYTAAGAQLAAAQLLTASAHWCSTAASGKFRMQVSKASAYRCPTVVRYKLRCAKVPVACTIVLEFHKTAVCCAGNHGFSLPGQAVQSLIASAHWCSLSLALHQLGAGSCLTLLVLTCEPLIMCMTGT